MLCYITNPSGLAEVGMVTHTCPGFSSSALLVGTAGVKHQEEGEVSAWAVGVKFSKAHKRVVGVPQCQGGAPGWMRCLCAMGEHRGCSQGALWAGLSCGGDGGDSASGFLLLSHDERGRGCRRAYDGLFETCIQQSFFSPQHPDSFPELGWISPVVKQHKHGYIHPQPLQLFRNPCNW